MMKKFWIVFLVTLLSTLLISGMALSLSREYEVKAAFLYNFARFIKWPSLDKDKPFIFCVLGTDPFGEALDELAGKTIEGRQVKVTRCKDLDEASQSQVLFISKSEQKRMAAIIKELHDSPVLTVSDIDRFVENGGMIQFIIEEGKIRFKINQPAAKSAGLKINSQLLKLGR